MLPQMKNLPVCSNHDESVPIGKVVDARITDNGAFEVDFEIDLEENIVHELIDCNLYTGLSLSHCLNSCRPVEVSVCWEGAREGTGIYSCRSNQQNLNQYIVEQPSDTIIRASITEANRIFKMNTAADDQKSPEAQQRHEDLQRQSLQQINDAVHKSQQQQQQPDQTMTDQSTANQQKDEQADDKAKDQEPSLESKLASMPAMHKLFLRQDLTKEDKQQISKCILDVMQNFKQLQKERETLNTQLELEKQRSKQIKETNRVSANAVVNALKDLGVKIDNTKCAEMERAINDTPLFMDGGNLGELIVQCSREKQLSNQQLQLQQQQDLNEGEKKALEMYQQFLALQDPNLMPADPAVRASVSQYAGTKRNFATFNSHTAPPMQPKPTGSRLASKVYGLDPALASLIEMTPGDADFFKSRDSGKRQAL